MAVNEFDQASRYTAKLDPPGFLAWALGVPPSAFDFREWLDTRGLPFPGDADHTGDTIARLENPDAGGVPWAVALEFQTEPDPLMFGRLLEYVGQLWRRVRPDAERGSRFQVGAVVLNLSGRGEASRDMEWLGMGTRLRVVERNLAAESAADLLGKIERGERSRALLPWLPLMTGADDAGMIERWKTAADAEPDTRLRSDYGGLAEVLSQVADRWDLWANGLKEWNVIKSKSVERWRAEGRVEGEAKGRVEALVASVTSVLEARFKAVPVDLGDKLKVTTDADALRSWLVVAARVDDLAAFRAQSGL